MFYEPDLRNHGLAHNPFKALIVPRPIGWISSRSSDGVANLAPYSYFNAVCDAPPIVMFSSVGWKDSVRNASQTGCFVYNLAGWDNRDAMNVSSAGVEADIDEFDLAGLTKVAAQKVDAPRVGEALVAMECETHHILPLPADAPEGTAQTFAVFGRVLGVHIDERLIADGRVDITRARPLSRLGYMDYGVTDDVFEMARPNVST